jgi:HSP20 family protein
MTLLKIKQEQPTGNRERFRTFPDLVNDLLFDNMITNDFRRSTVPGVNIVETADNFSIEMAAPGLKKEDFKIHLNNDVLTISSEKKSEENETTAKFTRKEYSYSSFVRSFNLPEMVDSEKIEAGYIDGIMKVVLPKKEEAKPKTPREVKIA